MIVANSTYLFRFNLAPKCIHLNLTIYCHLTPSSMKSCQNIWKLLLQPVESPCIFICIYTMLIHSLSAHPPLLLALELASYWLWALHFTLAPVRYLLQSYKGPKIGGDQILASIGQYWLFGRSRIGFSSHKLIPYPSKPKKSHSKSPKMTENGIFAILGKLVIFRFFGAGFFQNTTF